MAVYRDGLISKDEEYIEVPRRLSMGRYAKIELQAAVQGLEAIIIMVVIICAVLLALCVPFPSDLFSSQSTSSIPSDNNQTWINNYSGSGFYPMVTGGVNDTYGPIDGAYVLLSSFHIAMTTDLDDAKKAGLILCTTLSLTDGTFHMSDLSKVQPDTDYWLVSYAAFHDPNIQVLRFTKEASTVHVDMVMALRPMTWNMSGTLSRRGGEFKFDILAESRPFEDYGLRSSLMDRTLTAVVTWNNYLTKGGDLEIGYSMTCTEPSSNSAIQYPTQKNNQEQISVVLTPTVLDKLDGCGAGSTVFSIWVDNASWANDCSFTLTVSIS